MTEVIIKVSNTEIKTSTEELKDISEMPDGVVFNLKGGLSIIYTDNNMPSATKQIIKNTADLMSGKKLIFELDNPSRPAVVIGD